MAFDHVMIDCETLDTKPGGVILSVGAVRFSPTTFGMQSYEDLVKYSFRRNFDLQTSIDLGFTISASTLGWWMQQSKEAQEAAFGSGEPDFVSALAEFSEFFENRDKVWANGANFDPAMLEAYFVKFKHYDFPWAYNKVRCVRTVTSMNMTSKDHPVPDVKLAHDPVADCIYQVQKLQSIAIENPKLRWA